MIAPRWYRCAGFTVVAPSPSLIAPYLGDEGVELRLYELLVGVDQPEKLLLKVATPGGRYDRGAGVHRGVRR
jgi:hypothetical protein